MFHDVNDLESLGFSITDIPIIGSIIGKVKGEVDKQVQQLEQKVAEFKLLPSTLSNLQARAQNLLKLPSVTQNAASAASVQNALTVIAKLQRDFSNTNAVVDVALTQITAVKAGRVSVAAATSIASGASAIAEALNNAKHARDLVANVELAALTPAQRSQALSLGLSSSLATAGTSAFLVGALALGGYLLLRKK